MAKYTFFFFLTFFHPFVSYSAMDYLQTWGEKDNSSKLQNVVGFKNGACDPCHVSKKKCSHTGTSETIHEGNPCELCARLGKSCTSLREQKKTKVDANRDESKSSESAIFLRPQDFHLGSQIYSDLYEELQIASSNNDAALIVQIVNKKKSNPQFNVVAFNPLASKLLASAANKTPAQVISAFTNYKPYDKNLKLLLPPCLSYEESVLFNNLTNRKSDYIFAYFSENNNPSIFIAILFVKIVEVYAERYYVVTLTNASYHDEN